MTRSAKTSGFLTALAFWLLFSSVASAQAPSKPPAKPAPAKADYALPDVVTRKWTGDLDGMIKRRLIRVLVPYSKTLYFVDRGTQRGLVHDSFRLLEEDLNKKLQAKHLRVHVVFVPVARDEIIPALQEGRGDIAAANLTITPERLELVDFCDPTRRNVAEIAVSGPGAEPIATVEDLSGKEVYIRKSASFYESIEEEREARAKAKGSATQGVGKQRGDPGEGVSWSLVRGAGSAVAPDRRARRGPPEGCSPKRRPPPRAP